MKCKRVKDLMSEYIDGEINESQRKDITIHLKSCASCKKIETSLRQTIIAPLKGAEKASVPEDIWHGLRSAITAGEEKNFVWVRPLGIPRPVLVPIAITLFLVFTVTFSVRSFIIKNSLNYYMGEQMQFLSQLAENGEESYIGIEDINLGTSIEEYFL